jgi:hypothetical protein
VEATGSRQAIAASTFTIFIGLLIRLTARNLLLTGGGEKGVRGKEGSKLWFDVAVEDVSGR